MDKCPFCGYDEIEMIDVTTLSDEKFLFVCPSCYLTIEVERDEVKTDSKVQERHSKSPSKGLFKRFKRNN